MRKGKVMLVRPANRQEAPSRSLILGASVVGFVLVCLAARTRLAPSGPAEVVEPVPTQPPLPCSAACSVAFVGSGASRTTPSSRRRSAPGLAATRARTS